MMISTYVLVSCSLLKNKDGNCKMNYKNALSLFYILFFMDCNNQEIIANRAKAYNN